MDGAAPEDLLDPPPRLYERLRQIAGYTWEEDTPSSRTPVHSTYDCWYVFGTRHSYPLSPPPSVTSSHNASSPGGTHRPQHGRPSLSDPTSSHDIDNIDSAGAPILLSTPSAELTVYEEPVVARLSYHGLREERAFQAAKALAMTEGPDADYVVEPLDLIRLAPVSGDRGQIIVAIYKDPGPNHLLKVLDQGPAFYRACKKGDAYVIDRQNNFKLEPPISLEHFLDFAIGATHCLEILHHGQGIIHGEIRGDAFHFNVEENKVRIVAFGSGMRSFENGLTSTGWSTLSKEIGAKNKLLYISPEQTGRMPAEPDSRTDIYSLGVLMWMLLTQQAVFEGDTPLDIVQGVLGRRIPNVSTVRMDIPDAIGRIILKCTAKNVGDRYQSASGLRHDLVRVQEYLGDGDWTKLSDFKVAEKDVSSFFVLPTIMIGRQREKSDILKVVDRVAKSHNASRKGVGSSRLSESSSLSTDALVHDDLSSEGGASSTEYTNRRSGSFTHTISSDTKQQRGSGIPPSALSDMQTASAETVSSSGTVPRPSRLWERHQSISMEARSLIDSVGTDGNRPSLIESSSTGLSRQLGTAKFRRRGRCEVVVVEGAGGLGKSCLVQDVLTDARRRGYCATAKFDSTRRVAYGPLLKLLSSLIKQMGGETNTDTPFHEGLKQYVRPMWPMLHRVLGLPEFLLGPPEVSAAWSLSSSQSSAGRGTNGRSLGRRRGSSPGSSPGRVVRNPSVASQTSQDYLRVGASTKSIRLVNTFLDVLRMFTTHKFVCFCLEDLHFADDESLDLINQIITSKMNMVIIMTYRPEELSSASLQSTLYPTDTDGMFPAEFMSDALANNRVEYTRSFAPTITRVPLTPLSEDDITEYVSTTLCRPREDVQPLALVLQSKTAGNPFYMREMLSACRRKKCIWYDYKDSQWHFDLDRLFEQFRGEKDYDVLDTAFITTRLSELQPSARALLAWAALLGGTFSFELISRLMGGEFDYEESEVAACSPDVPERGWSEREAIAGLQAAIQAYIIVPTETEDRFRFAHDRYVHASAALKECNARRMHSIIAQTLLKYYVVEARQRDSTAFHICLAGDIIRNREPIRRPYRRLLAECAQAAAENSARPTAAKYYSAAVFLLQDDPWDDSKEDVSYDETMQLYLRSAECHVFMGQLASASGRLSTIFSNAKTAIDKAPAYVLQSRIYASNGNSEAALYSLKECLGALGVIVDEFPTYEKCDERFEKLSIQIQTMDRATITRFKQPNDPTMSSIGAVLSETISAGWWSDCLRFYHLTLVMAEMHLSRGAFPQSGMAFIYLGMIALSRFNMAEFTVELGAIAQDLLYQANDPISMARGMTLYPTFIGHIHTSMASAVSVMEDAVEFASLSGDRLSTILSYGHFAQVKFWASENYVDLEAFCQYGCEEIPNWHYDTRGGSLLLAVKQVSRAMQGKTRVSEPRGTMTDEQHDSLSYKRWLASQTEHSNRSILFYQAFEMMPLFLFGHYDRAVEMGEHTLQHLPMLWSSRNSRMALLFYGLALAGQLLRQMHDPTAPPQDLSGRAKQVLQQLRGFIKQIEDWSTVSDANYLSWTRMLEGQFSELSGEHGQAVQNYEEAMDHAAEQSFVFEEALGNYLMAGFFLRRRARRSARAALLEAVGLYRQLGATGVAHFIEGEHSLLLHSPTRNHQTADVGAQTDFVADNAPVPLRVEGGEMAQLPPNMNDVRGDRIGAWRGTVDVDNEPNEPGAGLPALDMIDLHAILVSSQVISSVLRVDQLLKTMCDVILQTCGGSASLAAIVVQETDGEAWCIAASGDPENGASAHKPGLPLAGTSLIAENVVLYCTRFLESVFVSDLVSDERFGNISSAWLQKNPLGKAIISIPISHGTKSLLGVLYLEGEPGSFTDRNVTVLQLLVNQIGISYSNALSMNNLEKISAENRSMVLVQKRALGKALAAETKAKDAEAEAKRNVKLAEEAAKAKSIFLANVSHELRTPLNGVIGNSELLRDSSLNREQLEMADSIRVSADLLLTVINDILDFSKMEADKMKLYIIAFNPEEMVREVVRAVSYSNREKTSKKNVKIIQDINLPPMLIYGDPIRLHQVMGNLIGNSLKFTEDGSITIGARLDSDSVEKATLTFWVRDTGIGIPPQQLVKLFQPFSQADASTARKYGGSGLGLSICKSLIEIMMKGKIQLESEEKVGTTAWFTVTFEKTKKDVAAGDAQAKSSPPIDRYSATTLPVDFVDGTAPYVNLSNVPKEEVRICVAEDNPINQKIAIQYVQRLGYSNVIAYENGLRAVEGLRQMAKEGKPYHVVLMDVQMPVLDGYEATKLIRKDPLEAVRTTLVIAMTASAIQGDREKCLAAGMNDYLAKPVRSEVLKKKLDAYLGTPHTDNPDGGRKLPGSPSIPQRAANGSARAAVDPVARDPPHPLSTVMSDPMQEEAVFNKPLDSESLEAKDSPIQEAASLPTADNGEELRPRPLSLAPRTASEQDILSVASALGEASISQPQKRQPRKLTKSRLDGEAVVERPLAEKPVIEKPGAQKPPVAERNRGVLTKKSSTRQNTTNMVDGAPKTENAPPEA